MSTDPIQRIASWILRMNGDEITRLRKLLAEGGDPAGVGAVIPPNLPLKEDGTELQFEEWPDDYWESQA